MKSINLFDFIGKDIIRKNPAITKFGDKDYSYTGLILRLLDIKDNKLIVFNFESGCTRVLPEIFTDENWLLVSEIEKQEKVELDKYKGKSVRCKETVYINFKDILGDEVLERATKYHVILKTKSKKYIILDSRYNDIEKWEIVE